MSVIFTEVRPTADRPLRARWQRLPLYAVEAAAALLMAGIAVLVFANALGRKLFARPLPWTEEVVLNAMIWVGACGVVIAASRGAMMCCDMIVVRLPKPVLRMMRVFTGLLGAGLLAFFAHTTWRYIELFGSDLSPMLRWPKSVGMYGLLFALCALAIVLCIQVHRALKE